MKNMDIVDQHSRDEMWKTKYVNVVDVFNFNLQQLLRRNSSNDILQHLLIIRVNIKIIGILVQNRTDPVCSWSLDISSKHKKTACYATYMKYENNIKTLRASVKSSSQITDDRQTKWRRFF